MRLLNTLNVKLEEFYDDEIPQYAILSHTWGKEEVSFQAFSKEDLRMLAGHRKITSCCALAASEKIGYLWVDTCCIDKTSSAELSEAINSMFRWYQNAKICYAYLADVDSVWYDVPVRSLQDFSNSRWFTRGWTLQELLAPTSMVFYNKNWERIGGKSQLIDHISQATSIKPHHLIDPASASVATKMSWASKRKTTRSEDLAYCLMGLFDVNMPLLYGEGQKAFLRLQHEILRIVDDESIFAWKDDDLIESGMLALSPAAFVDCKDIVSVNYTLFHRRDTYAITNRGLSIDLVGKVTDCHESCEMLPLHCAREEDKVIPIAIRLKKESPYSFVRSSPNTLLRFDKGLFDPRIENRRVYVRPSYLRADLPAPRITVSLGEEIDYEAVEDDGERLSETQRSENSDKFQTKPAFRGTYRSEDPRDDHDLAGSQMFVDVERLRGIFSDD